MNVLRKNFTLIVSFILGVLITYLAMSLHHTRSELAEIREKEEIFSEEREEATEKHWMDEMLEKQAEETEELIKSQQAEGDVLKKQFEKFAE